MSHYAKVVNGTVTQVIVAEAEFFNHFVDTSPGYWIQTSYNSRGNVHYLPNSSTPSGNAALRGNYAGVGYIYNQTHDVFYPPQPANTAVVGYTLNTSTWSWTPNANVTASGNTIVG